MLNLLRPNTWRTGLFCLMLPLLATGSVQAQSPTLFQQLGQEQGISLVVDELLRLALQDQRISATFKDSNMRRLAKLLKEQICVVSDGPCNYTGDDMKVVHESMGISSAQFNALAEDLQIAMDKFNVPSTTQNRLIARLAPMKRDIVRAKK
ncbi:MAG: group 1 truncated hemoglobin [Burkholderiales bacterium]|nr:group 1 truncated hemoglobin [Burkholderiales bacterium]